MCVATIWKIEVKIIFIPLGIREDSPDAPPLPSELLSVSLNGRKTEPSSMGGGEEGGGVVML